MVCLSALCFLYALTMQYAWASPQDNDERVQLFVKMCAGHKLDPPFKEAIHTAIRTSLNRRHLLADIFKDQELPVSAYG